MLTACDWMLALAAYAYEQQDDPIITDNSYDMLCKLAGQRNTELPGFSDMTGQWVHGMDFELLGMIYEYVRDLSWEAEIHMPAVIAALDSIGIEYSCCISTFNCWD